MTQLPEPTSPTAAEIDAACTAVQNYWSAMTHHWPWMRQQSLRPIYILAGELLIQLIQAFPAQIHSNEARWYAREIGDSPSIYVLFPEQFADEARKRLGGGDPHLVEGKQAITFLFLARQQGIESVAKTLLISTEQQAPMFRAQLAHELLHGACATDWDGQRMRSGMRLVTWGTGAAMQRGGMLNDLLLDVLLLEWLPTATNYTRGSLLDGQQGPYWRIAEALGRRLDRAAIEGALFGMDADRLILENLLNEALERGDGAEWLDRALTRRDWATLMQATGAPPMP